MDRASVQSSSKQRSLQNVRVRLARVRKMAPYSVISTIVVLTALGIYAQPFSLPQAIYFVFFGSSIGLLIHSVLILIPLLELEQAFGDPLPLSIFAVLLCATFPWAWALVFVLLYLRGQSVLTADDSSGIAGSKFRQEFQPRRGGSALGEGEIEFARNIAVYIWLLLVSCIALQTVFEQQLQFLAFHAFIPTGVLALRSGWNFLLGTVSGELRLALFGLAGFFPVLSAIVIVAWVISSIQ